MLILVSSSCVSTIVVRCNVSNQNTNDSKGMRGQGQIHVRQIQFRAEYLPCWSFLASRLTPVSLYNDKVRCSGLASAPHRRRVTTKSRTRTPENSLVSCDELRGNQSRIVSWRWNVMRREAQGLNQRVFIIYYPSCSFAIQIHVVFTQNQNIRSS